MESIERDGNAVVIRLSRPFAPLPAQSGTLEHRKSFPPRFWDDGDAVQPIGHRILPGGSVRTAASHYRWRHFPTTGASGRRSGTPATVFAADDATRLAMVEAGEAELAFELDAFAAAAAGSQVTVQSEETARIRALKLNVGQAPFDDLRVRQAISLAIDRDGIATALLGNPGIAATQLMPAAVAGWYRPDLAPFAHDPAAARALLAEAGWSPGSGGVLETRR